MSTTSKVLIGIAVAVALVFAALVITVTVIFDPEDYRAYIVDAAEARTGRTFALEGELGLDVLPCCSVALGPARLGNPPGFPDDEFAAVRSASLSLALWPLLLRQEVQIDAISVEGADIRLLRLEDGRVNWELESAGEAAEPEDGTGTAFESLTIDSFALSDARIAYRDTAAGTAYTVTGAELHTGSIGYRPGPRGAEVAAFPLQGAATVSDDVSGLTAQVNLEARIALEAQRAILESPVLEAELSGPPIPLQQMNAMVAAERLEAGLGETLALTVHALDASLEADEARFEISADGRLGAAEDRLAGQLTLRQLSPRELLTALSDGPVETADETALASLAGTGRWTLQGEAFTVEDLNLELDDTRLTGSLAVANADDPAVRFDLDVDQMDLDRYLPPEGEGEDAESAEPTTVPLETLAAVRVNGSLRARALRLGGADLEDVTLTLESGGGNAAVRLAGGALNGSFELAGSGPVTGDDPHLAGTLTAESLSPRALLAALESPMETADPEVLNHLSGTGRWHLEPAALALSDLRWRLDDSELTGSVRVVDFDTLATRFDLAVDRLNVDAYLAAEEEAEAAEAEAAEIPVELVRGLDLEGQLAAGELVVLNMTLQDVRAEVTAGDGVLRLAPLRAGLYGGEYRGTLAVDATGPEATVSLDQQVADVRAEEIMQSFFGSDLLAGSLSFDLEGTGTGNTPADLLRAMAGDLSLDLRDGLYRGTDLRYQLERALAVLRRQTVPDEPEAAETPIREMSLRGRLVDGVLQSEALNLATPFMTVAGRGGLDLMELALDYELDAQVLEDAGGRLAELAGLTVPLTVTGPVRSPRVGVDLEGLLTTTVRQSLEQRAMEALRGRRGEAEPEGEAPAPEQGGEPAGEPSGESSGEPAGEQAPQEPESPRDLLRRGLRDLLKPPPQEDEQPESGG